MNPSESHDTHRDRLNQSVSINIAGTDISVDSDVYAQSAWQNCALTPPPFADADAAINCLSEAFYNYGERTRVQKFFFALIDSAKDKLKDLNYMVRNQMLATGPEIENDAQHHTRKTDLLELAYVDLLKCVDWIVEGNEQDNNELRRTGLITAAHILIESDKIDHAPASLGPARDQIIDKLRSFHKQSESNKKLHQAVKLLLRQVDNKNIFNDLEKLKKDHGELGSQRMAIRVGAEADDTWQIEMSNKALLTDITNSARRTHPEVWSSADQQVDRLLGNGLGHLFCELFEVCQLDHLQEAVFGIVGQAAQKQTKVIVFHGEWLDPLAKTDPQGRTIEDLGAILGPWLRFSSNTEDRDKLAGFLEIEVTDANKVCLDMILKLGKALFETDSEIKFYGQPAPDIDYTASPVLIIGDRRCYGYLHERQHNSVCVINAEVDIKFEVPVSKPDSSSKYLCRAVNDSFGPKLQAGEWNTAVLSPEDLMRIKREVLWGDLANDPQFPDLRRVIRFNTEGGEIDNLHLAHIFVSARQGGDHAESTRSRVLQHT